MLSMVFQKSYAIEVPVTDYCIESQYYCYYFLYCARDLFMAAGLLSTAL